MIQVPWCDEKMSDWMTLEPVGKLMSKKPGRYLERDGGDHYDRETRISFDSSQKCIKGEIQLAAYLINDIVLTISRRR